MGMGKGKLCVLNFSAKFLSIRQAAVTHALGGGVEDRVAAWSQRTRGRRRPHPKPAVGRLGAHIPRRSISMK